MDMWTFYQSKTLKSAFLLKQKSSINGQIALLSSLVCSMTVLQNELEFLQAVALACLSLDC